MIVDFQHHFTPRELMPRDLGRRKLVSYDEHGAPSFIMHWMLFDLDEHIRMMDEAGIDVAVLTSAAGMCADIDKSRLCNESAQLAQRDYPGRFIGAAHANPLGGAEALRELGRCKHDLGFPGVVITSETNDLYLDAPQFEPFWTECEKLGVFIFVHPALKLNQTKQFDGYDTARSVGREFSLVMATIRLINSGVFDRHPSLAVHMSHLGGGLSPLLGRIRSYQDKEFWGTLDNARHGMKPKNSFDYYLHNNMLFDTAGFCGAIGAIKGALIEIPASRIVFATDYPQEIRERGAVRDFIKELRALGSDGEAILAGNVGKLLNVPARAA
jgi:predicted TIM-barrel fold metal-dependent hydrolase